MGDRAAAEVGVVLEDHVARLELLVKRVEEERQVRAELADQHLPVAVRDQRVGVVRLADHGRNRGAEHDRVHLVADPAQRVLDDLQRDRVDAHGSLSISTFDSPSTRTRAPGWTSVVESSCSITAGPASSCPGSSLVRS